MLLDHHIFMQIFESLIILKELFSMAYTSMIIHHCPYLDTLVSIGRVIQQILV